MCSYFMQSGDMFAPTPSRDSVLDTLPIGNYIVVETMQGLRFQRSDAFKAPGRMYGDINQRAERILNTFMDRPRTTGVLLEGEKGSGKSQLARNISHAAYAQNIPTILINAPFCGDGFNALLASIEQPAIILMDEFEKVYCHQEHQEQVLTLLDGMEVGKKLFVLTVNDKYRVNHYMQNRPGRIYYSLDFNGLETSFVREYCEENLNDQDEIENVLKIAALFKAFNFDMLKALVEEMNRYKESAFDVLEWLNAKPISGGNEVTYEVVATSPSGVKSQVGVTNELPMGSQHNVVNIMLTFEEPMKDETRDKLSEILDIDPSDYFERHFRIESKDLRKVDVNAGRYEFECDGWTLTFVKKQSASYDLRAF